MLADTHLRAGIDRLPRACIDIIAGADLSIHAGDFVSVQAVEELREVSPPVYAVHGNVDEPALRAELPERTTFAAAGVRIGLVHDAGPKAGRLDRLRRAFPDADVVVFGHSHIPLLERADDFAIFNPGSPMQRRRAPARTMGLISIGRERVEFDLTELPPQAA